ncbi:MAG: fasciclin domain-containing protein [Planctomycetota bacterium]|nr:fasciclin domain-containing protein [Planctomycetota bacterium]
MRDALGLGHAGRLSGAANQAVIGEPFVVTGTVTRARDGFLLMEDTMLCCTSFTVGFRVDADPGPEGEWVAVFGRLARSGSAAPRVRLQAGAGGFKVIVAGYVIEPERIVPAERLVQQDNLVDQMGSESLSIFARALRETGVAEVLRAADSITILVPVDQAFNEPEQLFLPENREQLRRLVLRHVIPTRLREKDLMEQGSVTSLTHEEFPVRTVNGSLRIARARTVFEDVLGSNGVMHLISAVLQPEDAVGAVIAR